MHETNKADKRYVKSEARLREAMIELLDREPFAAITIKKITDEAGVGRATFYKHYNDKTELLTAVEDELRADIIAVLAKKQEGSNRSAARKKVIALFNFLEANIRAAQVLLGPDGPADFQEEIREILWDGFHASSSKFKDVMRRSGLSVEYLKLANYTHFLVMQAWLRKKDREAPEELAEVMAKLTDISNDWIHETGLASK